MQAACDTGEVLALLEGGAGAGGALLSMYGTVREAWLTRGLLQYHARTGSARVLDVLARAPDHHARLLLDALAEELCAAPPSPRPHRALAALAPLLARRPLWLHRLHAHPVLRAVLRAARGSAPAPAPRLHALLALAALVQHAPPAPGAVPELAEAAVRAATAPEPHVQLAAHALFHALYATSPGALLEALRAECGAGRGERARAAIPALLETTRLHPALVLGGGVAGAGLGLLAGRVAEREAGGVSVPSPAPPSPAPAGSAGAVSRAASALRPPAEPWFALHERCGTDSAPHTPLPTNAGVGPGAGGEAPGSEGGSPPEAAVEATPENTPAKESRAHFTFPTESSSVRALGRLSQPPSPLRKETSPGAGAGAGGEAGGGGYAGRLARVVLDRAQAESGSPAPLPALLPRPSPVPFGGAPPAAVARPEPRLMRDEEPLNVEDREVLELTSRGEVSWPAGAGAGAGGVGSEALSVRELLAAVRPSPRSVCVAPPPARPAPPPRRAASCPPRARLARHDAATQTVDTTPEPYEFIISDYFANVTDKHVSEEWSVRPSARLDAYLQKLYSGEGGVGAAPGELGGVGAAPGELGGVLALTHAALQYERWRREAHAERCRRLLGRCRQTRALELSNAALRDRARALQRELDECRCRVAPAPAPGPAPAPAPAHGPAPAHDQHVAALEAQLAAEIGARERAEARLKECEWQCQSAVSSLQACQGAGWEAARRVEQLSRCAAAAERRAELVRRMRQELLLLRERERALCVPAGSVADLTGAVTAATTVRAAREEAAHSRAEAEALATRNETLTARLHEAEAALSARDATCAELRRAASRASSEHAACLAALQDKYRAALHVQRRLEQRRLELQAAAPAPAPALAPARAPAPAPPAHALHNEET